MAAAQRTTTRRPTHLSPGSEYERRASRIQPPERGHPRVPSFNCLLIERPFPAGNALDAPQSASCLGEQLLGEMKVKLDESTSCACL